jgi:hypothetical protein
MKYILLATLLCGMFSSCTENMSGKRQSNVQEKSLPYLVSVFNWKGHQYLRYTKGGLIHSESCKCKTSKL